MHTLDIVNEVCPDKKLLFDSIPLLARTVIRKLENISKNVKITTRVGLNLNFIFEAKQTFDTPHTQL